MDVALPVVSAHFRASASEASWIVLAFLLVNTALILVFGRVADLVGRRRLYIVGLSLFTAASFACGLAPNAPTLALLRGVQAIGAAALITNVTALLTDAFPRRLLTTALGMNVTVVSLAQMAGPMVGGALTQAFGWRAAFWFAVPVGVAGVIWAALALHPTPKPAEREPFDMIGAVAQIVGVAGLVLALAQGGATGWTSPSVAIGLTAFVIGIPTFIAVQRRREHPMVDLTILADRERMLAFICGFLVAVSRYGVALLMSLYLQAVVGLDPFGAGLYLMAMPLGLAALSPVAGRLARRYSARILSSIGASIILAGLVGLATILSPGMSRPCLAMSMCAIGAGTALFMTPNTSSIMAGVAPHQRGIANGLRSSLQNTGFVVSTAIGLSLATMWLSPSDKQSAYAGALSSLSETGVHAFTSGLRVALLVMAGACMFATIGSLLRNPPLPSALRSCPPVSTTRVAEGCSR